MSVNAMMEKIEDVTVLGHPMVFKTVCVRTGIRFQTACICALLIYKEKER